ncbi:MAG TPA: hypothetical protein PKN53_09260 [Bacteroidales bacterium]|jgi:hypothetical protein|nr:hypothetical protein [Bacteroidales bacterium]
MKDNNTAEGLNVKTINGKHGSFQVLRVYIPKFSKWIEENKDKNDCITLALYPRREADEYNNTHTPKKFTSNNQ